MNVINAPADISDENLQEHDGGASCVNHAHLVAEKI